MTFFRYRFRYAHGFTEWDYAEYPFKKDPPKSDLEEFVTGISFEVHDRYYRGVDVEIIERPPDEWLLREIKTAVNTWRRAQDTIERYEALLAKA